MIQLTSTTAARTSANRTWSHLIAGLVFALVATFSGLGPALADQGRATGIDPAAELALAQAQLTASRQEAARLANETQEARTQRAYAEAELAHLIRTSTVKLAACQAANSCPATEAAKKAPVWTTVCLGKAKKPAKGSDCVCPKYAPPKNSNDEFDAAEDAAVLNSYTLHTEMKWAEHRREQSCQRSDEAFDALVKRAEALKKAAANDHVLINAIDAKLALLKNDIEAQRASAQGQFEEMGEFLQKHEDRLQALEGRVTNLEKRSIVMTAGAGVVGEGGGSAGALVAGCVQLGIEQNGSPAAYFDARLCPGYFEAFGRSAYIVGGGAGVKVHLSQSGRVAVKLGADLQGAGPMNRPEGKKDGGNTGMIGGGPRIRLVVRVLSNLSVDVGVRGTYVQSTMVGPDGVNDLPKPVQTIRGGGDLFLTGRF